MKDFQDIGYQAAKGNDSWEMENKWGDPTIVPANYFDRFPHNGEPIN